MKKKKILLIAPVFMNYYKEIKRELEIQDYEVDFFCDSSSNSNIFKALSRINKNFVKIPMKKYFREEVQPQIEQNEYDFVLFIVAMSCSFSNTMIEKIRQIQKNAKFIMYQWDGENNLPFVNDMHQYFDKVYTFDRIDALNNTIYKFFPLFYIDKYEKIKEMEDVKYQYDVSYIGTAHPKKLLWINKMSKILKDVYPRQFIYHFLPSKLKYIYHKIMNKEYRNFHINDFHFEKLSNDEIMRIFENSKCILDAPQAGQNGLTIRTMECLGAKRKLITQNKDILNYDFYYPENILVFNDNIDFDNEFFKCKYKELPKEIYEKYSLRKWLKQILEE